VSALAGERRTEERRVVTGAGGLGALRRLVLEAVFQQEVRVVTLVQDLAFHVGVELMQPADLAVLLGDELLVQSRDLDVDVELGKVEVGREAVRDVAGAVPVDVERGRLVEPLDLIEVEQPRELSLAVVREVY
jgi:hypothetical protein